MEEITIKYGLKTYKITLFSTTEINVSYPVKLFSGLTFRSRHNGNDYMMLGTTAKLFFVYCINTKEIHSWEDTVLLEWAAFSHEARLAIPNFAVVKNLPCVVKDEEKENLKKELEELKKKIFELEKKI